MNTALSSLSIVGYGPNLNEVSFPIFIDRPGMVRDCHAREDMVAQSQFNTWNCVTYAQAEAMRGISLWFLDICLAYTYQEWHYGYHNVPLVNIRHKILEPVGRFDLDSGDVTHLFVGSSNRDCEQ